MQVYSQVYYEACNSGNALNKIIEVSDDSVSIKLAAQEARQKVVELVELIGEVAAFEQAEKQNERAVLKAQRLQYVG